jgi:hypothetical protein
MFNHHTYLHTNITITQTTIVHSSAISDFILIDTHKSPKILAPEPSAPPNSKNTRYPLFRPPTDSCVIGSSICETLG